MTPLTTTRHVWKNKLALNCRLMCQPLIVLIFLALLGWFGFIKIAQTTRATLVDKLMLIMNANVEAIKCRLDLRLSEVKGWAGYKDSHQELLDLIALADRDKSELLHSRELAKLRERLEPVCKGHGLLGFVVFDKSGEQIGALYDEAIGQNDLKTQSDFVHRSLQGETIISMPFRANIPLPDATGDLKPAQPTMFASTPIYDKGETVGVFAFRLRPESEFAILGTGRSGETGETYAFDRNGMMISDSRFNDQLRDKGLISHHPDSRAILTLRLNVPGEKQLTRMAASATRGVSGIDVDGYPDYRGIPVIGAWTWLRDFGFGVATEIDSSEAFTVLSGLRVLFLALYALLAMSSAISLVLRKREMQTEESRRRILDAAGEGIFGLDMDGLFTFINPSAEKMLLHTANEMIGRSAHALIHHSNPDGTPHPEDECSVSMAYRDGSERRMSNDVFWRKDGTRFMVDFINRPILEDGKLTGSVVTFNDITERARLEAERKQAKQIMQIFIEHTPAPVAMFDRDMRYLAYSRRWLTDYKLKSEDIRGRSHYEVFPEIPESWKEIHQRCLAGAVEKCDEDKFVRQDGTTEWLSWEINPWRDEYGLIGGIIMFTEVITERKKVEEMLYNANTYLELRVQERTAELMAANDLLRKLSRAAEQSPSSIIITDIAGRIEYVNPKFIQLSGFAPEEVIGKNPRFLKSGKTSAREYEDLWQTITSGGEWHGEFQNRKKNGDCYWGLAAISPIRDHQGEITHYISSMEDITVRKLTEDKIKAALSEKEVLMREINHRAKNNLQVVSSLIKMQSRDANDPKFAKLAQDLGNRISSMTFVHDQILQSKDLTQIETGHYLLCLTRNILSTYGENGGKTKLNIDTGGIILDVETSIHCGLIVNELLSNSLKYAFAPGQNGVINIILRHGALNGDLELIVHDNGAGISEDIDIRNCKSLGMRLVTTLAENQLQGRIELNRNSGTKFKIVFPARDTDENQGR